MSVPIALLGLLEREPSHGYDLKRDYDTYFGRGKPLPFGQVYSDPRPAGPRRQGGARRSRARRGTGPQALRHHRRRQERGRGLAAEPVEPEPHLQTVLFVKVVLALMLGRSAERYLDTQRGAHLQRMRELTELKRIGQPGRRAARRSRPVPPRSRPSLDRPDRGPAVGPRGGGAVMSAAHAPRPVAVRSAA